MFQKFVSVAMLPGRGPIFTGLRSRRKLADAPEKENMACGLTTLDGQLKLILREGATLTVGDKARTIRKFSLFSPVAGSGGQQRAFRDAHALSYRAFFTDGTQAVLKVALP